MNTHLYPEHPQPAAADDEITEAGTAPARSAEEAPAAEDVGELKEHVIEALRTVYDPEIPVNIYDLGLIYSVEIDDAAMVRIEMTLTAPGCPVAHTFPGMVEGAVRCVPGVSDAAVELVWDPPWTMDNMSEAAKLQLGLL